jgi:hypothetical protein
MTAYSDGRSRQAVIHLTRAELLAEAAHDLTSAEHPASDVQRRADSLSRMATAEALVGLLCEAEAIAELLGVLAEKGGGGGAT